MKNNYVTLRSIISEIERQIIKDYLRKDDCETPGFELEHVVIQTSHKKEVDN